jgi:glycogen debranching enzyme
MIYLGNKNGGYLAFPEEAKSMYHGVFFFNGQSLCKTVEEIQLTKKKELLEEKQFLSHATRTWEKGTEETFWYYKNTVLYQKTDNSEIELILDGKQSYDVREFGRYYTSWEENEKIIVHFQKKNDAKESLGPEYEWYMVLDLFGTTYSYTRSWIPKVYLTDKKREGTQKKRYRYSLLKTSAQKIKISFGIKRSLAFQESEKPFQRKKWKKEQPTCFDIAKNALENLTSTLHGETGILAGHPWFFQYWTRDEGMSTKGLWLIGEEKKAKYILLNAIKNIDKNGRIPNRIPESDLECADGVGWIFFRLKELFEMKKLTGAEIQTVKKYLSLSLKRIESCLMEKGLVWNRPLETWMDTGFNTDKREGKRIEIQALTLQMYRLLHAMSEDDKVQQKAFFLKKNIQNTFWNGQYLQDGSEDSTIRPNIFLAFYIAPDLLTKKQWRQCFDIAIQHLWLPWGGFSSIDKSSSLFSPYHTGQNNKSYHRGDSWYFVNNIAAIALLQVHKKYIPYIKKIYEASKKDLLSLGAKGCCSELSSANKQHSEGCFQQAWSNATFIELLFSLEDSNVWKEKITVIKK